MTTTSTNTPSQTDNSAPTSEPEKSMSKTPKTPKKTTKKRTTGGPPRPFPAMSLEEALLVPQLIKEKNGGNPWPPSELAKALDLKPKANKMWYITSSAQNYGLTTGTRDTSTIALTELGRRIVYAPNRQDEVTAIKEAFFHVEVFKSVYEYYQGGQLPEVKYLENTLENTFKVNPKHHAEFHSIFGKNQTFLGSFPELVGDVKGEKRTIAVNTSHSIVLGGPKKKTGLKAFVAMPFSEKTGKYPLGFYQEVLKNLIIPAGVEAGFEVETAKKEGSDIIHATIINDLLDADLAIVDLSDHNPNVLFELGVRLAFDKPTALIRAEGTPPIFDVDHLLRVYEYKPNLWKSTIDSDLPKITEHIKAAWANRENKKTYMKILRNETGV